MILDIYYRKPVLWDYSLASFVTMLCFWLCSTKSIILPETQDSFSLTGDLTTINLTLAGFILTILTVLITFKGTGQNYVNKSQSSIFDKFFSTQYYFITAKILRNCIKSIAFIAAIGFFLKMFLTGEQKYYLFFYNIFGIIITILTILRCLFILGRILDIQK